jgi:hypothetical protein
MRLAACLAAGALCVWAQRPDGLKPRPNAIDYATNSEDKGVRIGAEIVSPDNVRNLFSTDLSSYVVVEVAVWPASGKPLDLSAVDFALKLDSSRGPVRPVSPRTISGVLQRKGQSRRDDIVLYPTVGVTTGTWGTGTSVGVGVGMGGGPPGPASTDQDRRTMQMELEDSGLPETIVQKPVAGYLYFPAGSKNKKLTSVELIYDSDAASVKMTLPADK